MIKRIKNFKNKTKQGFTLIELLLAITITALFAVLLSALSTAIVRNFDIKNEYNQALIVRDTVLQSLKNELKSITNIAFSGEPGIDNISSSDFGYKDIRNGYLKTPLYNYNAVFSYSGKIFKIEKDTFRDDFTINNISDIEKLKNQTYKTKGSNYQKYLSVEKDPNNKITNISFKNNKKLKPFFSNQNLIYLSKQERDYNQFNDVYKGLDVDIAFTPFYESYESNYIAGVTVSIKIRNVGSSIYLASYQENITMLNIRDKAKQGKSAVDLNPLNRDDFDKANADQKYYSILYYNREEA